MFSPFNYLTAPSLHQLLPTSEVLARSNFPGLSSSRVSVIGIVTISLEHAKYQRPALMLNDDDAERPPELCGPASHSIHAVEKSRI